MTDSIIVKGLSKQYRIGKVNSKNMFREALMNLLKYPFLKERLNDESIWALKDVSFTVEDGEVLGIIGRNGAGKSTLLKVISKITYPTSGEIWVHGRIGSLLEVGTGFHSELTGRENIYLNGSILGMTKKEIDAKYDQIIAFADVEKFIDTPIKRYSSGMHLRLGFAVAAHLDTDILLVDEVLAVGDVGFQRKCMDKMGDLRCGGRTILFVSHSMAAIENLCSRVIWIDSGAIRRDGNPNVVIKEYLSSFAEGRKGGIELGEMQNRRGNGAVRFTRVEFLDKNRQPIELIRSGDGLIVRFYYHAEREISNNIIFGFRVYTDLGTLVTDVSNGRTGTEISSLDPGDGHLEVEIDFVNLMPNRYYMSLWLHNDGGIVYDNLEHSIILDIEVSDYYKSGKGMKSENGIMFLPFKWNLDGLHFKKSAINADTR